MAQKGTLRKDPWKKLVTREGNQQVGLEEILTGLCVDDRAGRDLKKALIERVTWITQRR